MPIILSDLSKFVCFRVQLQIDVLQHRQLSILKTFQGRIASIVYTQPRCLFQVPSDRDGHREDLLQLESGDYVVHPGQETVRFCVEAVVPDDLHRVILLQTVPAGQGVVQRLAALLVIGGRDHGDGFDLLLPEESVKYSYVDKKNTRVVVTTASDTIYRFGKIFILLDRFTLSSAEIFTSALRTNLGAVVAGETSGGKGTIITPLEINSESYVMFPKYEYFSSRGETVEGKGIKPDMSLDELKTVLPADLYSTLL